MALAAVRHISLQGPGEVPEDMSLNHISEPQINDLSSYLSCLPQTDRIQAVLYNLRLAPSHSQAPHHSASALVLLEEVVSDR